MLWHQHLGHVRFHNMPHFYHVERGLNIIVKSIEAKAEKKTIFFKLIKCLKKNSEAQKSTLRAKRKVKAKRNEDQHLMTIKGKKIAIQKK